MQPPYLGFELGWSELVDNPIRHPCETPTLPTAIPCSHRPTQAGNRALEALWHICTSFPARVQPRLVLLSIQYHEALTYFTEIFRKMPPEPHAQTSQHQSEVTSIATSPESPQSLAGIESVQTTEDSVPSDVAAANVVKFAINCWNEFSDWLDPLQPYVQNSIRT